MSKCHFVGNHMYPKYSARANIVKEIRKLLRDVSIRVYLNCPSITNIGPDGETFEHKIVIIFSRISYDMCFGLLKRTVSLRQFY